MKVTKSINFVVEVIVCDCDPTFVLRHSDFKPICTSDNVSEAAEQIREIVSQIINPPVKD